MKVDLYSGFEGEPEIIIELRRPDAGEQSISAWIGYFDELMNVFEPSPDGWQGLLHHYHCSPDWEDFRPWMDPDPALTLSQLLQLVGNPELSGGARLLLTNYIDLLQQASEHGSSISIREE